VTADHGAKLHHPMIRNAFRLAPKKDWDALRRDMEPI
jgi:hypothetical protein